MRRTRHRRRFHTDRIVRNRRAQWEAEGFFGRGHKRLTYGALTNRNPFDCGRARCRLCHWNKLLEPRRAREKRWWREDWEV